MCGFGTNGEIVTFSVSGVLCLRPTSITLLTRSAIPCKILVGLGRQPDHEIKLDPPPAALDRRLDRPQQVLFGHILVDDIAQALRSGLGRERQPALADPLNLGRKLHALRIRPQARQRNPHPCRPRARRSASRTSSRSASGPRSKARSARSLRSPYCQGASPPARRASPASVPAPAGDHPRLAEPAASAAAPHYLQRDPVVHGLGKRHNQPIGKRRVLQIAHHPRPDRRLRSMRREPTGTYTPSISASAFKHLLSGLPSMRRVAPERYRAPPLPHRRSRTRR